MKHDSRAMQGRLLSASSSSQMIVRHTWLSIIHSLNQSINQTITILSCSQKLTRKLAKVVCCTKE